MIDSEDIDYFKARALEELALSRSAPNPAAAIIHSNLAKRYERIAAEGTTKRRASHITHALRTTVSAHPEP